MSWITLCENAAACSVENFYSGVDVWLRRPNVVNKRLLGAVAIVEEEQISMETALIKVNEGSDVERGRQALVALAQHYCKELQRECCLEEDSNVQSAVVLKSMVRQLLPKMRSSARGSEAVLIDLTNHSVIFCPLSSLDDVPTVIPASSYRLQFSTAAGQDHNKDNTSSSRIYLQIRSPHPSPIADTNHHLSTNPPANTSTPNGVTVPTREWLSSILLPKIAQWSEESSQQLPVAAGQRGGRGRGRGESLIPLGRYSQLYAELKEKYGPTLVQNWPEGTDPHKFVYEDIAIATYLLVLWEGERKELGLTRKQSFIDLGCGNGLLVYLLTSEGHPGKGIDLRERKIWKMYKGTALLEVCSLVPSARTVFPDHDWLIGNHSDELTPWIPVMASRSSLSTCYFVLPCCAHDFNKRFTRPTTGKSQYQCYLDYVREIGEKMGFAVREDTLRIPSSKRICQIGMKRSYLSSEEATIDQQRMEFLIERCGSKPTGHGHTHRDLVRGDQREIIGNECISLLPTTTTLSQSGDLDRTCDNHTTPGKSNYAKNFVHTHEEHHQLQPQDGPSDNSSSISPPRPRMVNYPSLSQGRGGDVTLHDCSCQNLDKEQLQPKNDSILSPSCLVNHRSLGQGHGEEMASLSCSCPWSEPSEQLDVSLAPLESGFKPRDPTEVVRNCSHVNWEVKKIIVDTLTRQLLQTENYIIVYQFQDGHIISSEVAESWSSSCEASPVSVQQQHAAGRGTLTGRNERGKCSRSNGTEPDLKLQRPNDHECTTSVAQEEEQYGGGDGGAEYLHCEFETIKWNLGGKIHLSEAAAMFDSGVLSQLKREYGGLQTLLRNEHQIFKVCGGYIQLRNWSQFEHGPRKSAKPLSRSQKEAKGLLYKTKLCWFHSYHPQGCPRRAGDCPYAHGENELRERPNFREILDCSKELVSLT